MTNNIRPSGDFTAIQNSSSLFQYADANTKQLDMFDKIDMALFSANMFAWEADFTSKAITHTSMEDGNVKSISFYEMASCVHTDDAQAMDNMLLSKKHEDRSVIDIDARIKHNGAFRWFKIRGTVHVMPEGRSFAAGVAYDIDHSKTHIERLEHLQLHDYLTGLKNVQAFDTFVKGAENTDAAQHTLLVANIDGLKDVNETLGYYAGNQLIKNVSNVIRECFDDAKIVARVAGGEYCAIFFGKENIEIEMKIKEADMLLHRMYLNLIKTEVSFAFASSTDKFDFGTLYRDVTHHLQKTKNIKKLLGSKTYIDCIADIIATKAGWGRRSVRLQSLSAQVGAAMHCSNDYIQEIKILAKIADIGLIGLEDRLVKNRLRLGGKDKLAYMTHVEHGRKLIVAHEALTGFEGDYLDIYKRYDEWKDGLSIGSRIVAAALRYDDIITSSERMKFERIKDIMQNDSGSKYCPEVVNIILCIMERYNG